MGSLLRLLELQPLVCVLCWTKGGRRTDDVWTMSGQESGKSWARAVKWTRGHKRTCYERGVKVTLWLEVFSNHTPPSPSRARGLSRVESDPDFK
ncbi:MAG: hypothetical protein LM590_08245 [Thermofilum sp.]|nr:hypothetical protein [Thermofilum sp.]